MAMSFFNNGFLTPLNLWPFYGQILNQFYFSTVTQAKQTNLRRDRFKIFQPAILGYNIP